MYELLKLRKEVKDLKSNMEFYNNLAHEHYFKILEEKENELFDLELLNLLKGV